MISLFTEYLTDIEQQIADHQAQLEEKRQEVTQLQQLENDIDDALVILRNVVKNIKDIDPGAINLLKQAALSVFGDSEIVVETQVIPSEEQIKDTDIIEPTVKVVSTENEKIIDETSSKDSRETQEITWREIPIKVIYHADCFQSLNKVHIEIDCNQPLPLTDTGYKSIFVDTVDVPNLNTAVSHVINLLDEKVSEANWQPENQFCLF